MKPVQPAVRSFAAEVQCGGFVHFCHKLGSFVFLLSERIGFQGVGAANVHPVLQVVLEEGPRNQALSSTVT